MQINREDYKCLSVNKCINDAIIDFYLKYLHEEKLTDEQRNRTYIFSQFFYTRLAADGHAGVKKWSKNVNLYEKDFIIVPIIIGNHWILAVICFPHDSSKHTNEKYEICKLVLSILFGNSCFQVVYIDIRFGS